MAISPRRSLRSRGISTFPAAPAEEDGRGDGRPLRGRGLRLLEPAAAVAQLHAAAGEEPRQPERALDPGDARPATPPPPAAAARHVLGDGVGHGVQGLAAEARRLAHAPGAQHVPAGAGGRQQQQQQQQRGQEEERGRHPAAVAEPVLDGHGDGGPRDHVDHHAEEERQEEERQQRGEEEKDEVRLLLLPNTLSTRPVTLQC